MQKLFAAGLLLVLLSGCKTKPIYHGPNYQLNDVPEQAKRGPVALEIQDARPWWEKRYYDGYFKLVPLENLKPSPLPLLAEQIQRQAQDLPDPPQRVSLAVDSFRIVIYDKAKEDAAWDKTFILKDDYEPDEPAGWIGAIFVECAAQIAYHAALLTRDGVIEWGQKERHLHGPPRHIKDKYPEGLSCDLRVSAVLEWANGRKQTTSVRALVNGAALMDDELNAYRQGTEFSSAVHAACMQVAHEWAERMKNPNPGEDPPHRALPQFTAFGGR